MQVDGLNTLSCMVLFNGKNALPSNAMVQTVKTIGLTDGLDWRIDSALSYVHLEVFPATGKRLNGSVCRFLGGESKKT